MKRFMKWTVGLAIAALAAQTASADIVTVPTALGVGDSYRLVFITSTKTVATDTTAAYYNDFVYNLAQSVPALAALSTTWTVMGNLNGANTWVNTGTTGDDLIPIYRMNDTVFAADYTALKAAPTVPVLYNEKGEALTAGSAGRVWTGMTETMSVPGFSTPIGNGGSGGSTAVGATDSTWYTWGQYGDPNTSEHHLYAMSGVITVIPEPATFGMIGIAGIAMLLRRRMVRG